MLVKRSLSLLFVVFAATMIAVPVHAQEITENTKEQLRQLKMVCDEGLVSPEVCKEKQRAILGLRISDGSLPTNPSLITTRRPVPGNPHVTVAANGEIETRPPRRIRVSLPSGWSPFSAEKLRAGREALMKRLEQLKGDPKVKGLQKYLAVSTDSASQASFHNDGDFLQIVHLSPSLVLEPNHMERACQTMFDQAEAMDSDGQSPELLDCGLRQMGTFQTLYVEKNSTRDGARMIELWVAKSPEETFHFLLRCKADHTATRTKELEDIISSVQWR